jgi:hypothetical protein
MSEKMFEGKISIAALSFSGHEVSYTSVRTAWGGLPGALRKRQTHCEHGEKSSSQSFQGSAAA